MAKAKMAGQPQDDSWDNLQKKLGASFLQSTAWESFQHTLGLKVHKLKGDDWSCLLIERHTRLGSYLFAPYGPTLKKTEALEDAFEAIAAYAKTQEVGWVRLEPCPDIDTSSDLDEYLHSKKIKSTKAPKQVEPLYTRVLNLEPTEEELLAGLSKTTRYTVRKNNTEGIVSFKTSTDPNDMQEFFKMLGSVSDRNKVFFHPESYFLKQAETLMPKRQMWLEFALQDGKPVASIVMCGFDKTATYLYAASLPEARPTSASALLLWQAMLNAKAAGYTRLDLYGVAPENSGPNHPWQGFTAFKQKFGGQVIKRGKTIDLPLKPIYYLYRAVYKARLLLR